MILNERKTLSLRSEKNLKYLWDNLKKKNARKAKANEQKELFKTGKFSQTKFKILSQNPISLLR